MELMKRYEALLDKVVERKAEFGALMEFVHTKTSYLTAPASIRYHMNKERGLLEHSVNVAQTMLKLKQVLAPQISDESCVIVALLHDLGKAGVAGQPQYLATARGYSFNTELTYLSVPLRSLYLALPYLPLSEEEAQAIAYHDGQYVADNRSVAAKECPLTLLLQYADNWSGFVMEKEAAA